MPDIPPTPPRREDDTTGAHRIDDTLEVGWSREGALVLRVGRGTDQIAAGMLVETIPPVRVRVGESSMPRLTADERARSGAPGGAMAADAGMRLLVSGLDLSAIARVERARDEAVVLHVTLDNVGTAPVRLRRFFPFVTGTWWEAGTLNLAGRTSDFALYKNGWQSWSYAGGLPPRKADPRPRNRTLVAWHSPGGGAPTSPRGKAADVVSEEMAMLGASDLPVALLAGFLSADRWIGQVYADRRAGAFAAAVLLDGLELAPGGTVELPPLWLALGPQRRLLTAYADAVARELDARGARRVHTGWCSWYYYFTGVTEAAVVENLAEARAVRCALPVEVVQIDDGYQAAIGDWLSVNDRFPSGMADVASRIRDAGFRPGLWLAPFTIGANSALARSHPEWLVRGEGGKLAFAGHNWDTDLRALDTTHPGARDWLREVFTTIVREWGFDYLKLDFLACAAVSGVRHDTGATRAGALREGLRLIREVVGDEVYLLGCGCPWLSAVGVVDAMRIGPDSAPYWTGRYQGVPVPFSEAHALPTMEGAVRNTLTRAWMHRTLWVNDPDCLLVRERNSELTLDEVQAFASAVGLTGGMVVVSDRLRELPGERRDILARLLPPLPVRALPVDYFEAGIPERVSVSLKGAVGPTHLVGLFNQDARDREVTLQWSDVGLTPREYHATEFWSGAYLGTSSSGVRLRLNPHGAAVLAIRPATSAPTLLSTSFHVSQGATDVVEWSYDAEGRMVRWRSALGRVAQGQFVLWLPPGLLPHGVRGGWGQPTWRRNATGEVVVTAEIRGEAQFEMELTTQ